MTKEEAIKLLSNKKVFVKNKSKEIQLKLFEIGFGWDICDESNEAKYLEKPFLFFDDRFNITWGDSIIYFYQEKTMKRLRLRIF